MTAQVNEPRDAAGHAPKIWLVFVASEGVR
jgi:hypothetical protein